MYLKSLRLCHFRNLADQSVDPCNGVNLIIGKNGQGKTNLIEAVSLLSVAKSFRTNFLQECVKYAEASASVFGCTAAAGADPSEPGTAELGVIINRDSPKECYLNGKKLSALHDLIGKLITVCFSPTDIMIIKGAPNGRRRFVDRHMAECSPAIMKHLIDYHRALKNKNYLLKGGKPTAAQIEAWDAVMAVNSAVIESSRLKFLNRLRDKAQAVLRELSPQDGALRLVLEDYQGRVIEHEEQVSAEAMLRCFRAARARELQWKKCLVGPHRDDISITIEARDTKRFASQGQARTAILSLKLSVVQLIEDSLGQAPVVLLDDVDSELDSERSEALLRLILKQKQQVFLTGTRLRERLIDALAEYKIMEVESGLFSVKGARV